MHQHCRLDMFFVSSFSHLIRCCDSAHIHTQRSFSESSRRLTLLYELLQLINFYPLNRPHDVAQVLLLFLSSSLCTSLALHNYEREKRKTSTEWDAFSIPCNSVNIDWWAKLLLLTISSSSLLLSSRASLRHKGSLTSQRESRFRLRLISSLPSLSLPYTEQVVPSELTRTHYAVRERGGKAGQMMCRVTLL